MFPNYSQAERDFNRASRSRVALLLYSIPFTLTPPEKIHSVSGMNGLFARNILHRPYFRETAPT